MRTLLRLQLPHDCSLSDQKVTGSSVHERSHSTPVVDLILASRLVAILRLDDLTHSIKLVESLLGAGVRAVEFTLTNPDAPAVITELRRVIPAFSDGTAAIGLGSIRNAVEARMAVDAGAQFLVSPIALESIVDEGKKHDVAVCLGAYSPTEIAMGWDFGADIIKVFPARSLGQNYVRDVLAPMPYLRLMPTGGVDLANMADYFNAGAVAVGVGGKFVDPGWIRNEQWDEVTRAAAAYVLAASPNANAHANSTEK